MIRCLSVAEFPNLTQFGHGARIRRALMDWCFEPWTWTRNKPTLGTLSIPYGMTNQSNCVARFARDFVPPEFGAILAAAPITH
jgi:hypothetical protein